MPEEATWERTRDRIAITYRIILGKDDDAVERMAQAYATNSRPVIRMYSVSAVKDIYSEYGSDITLRTAEVVSAAYYKLIDARKGKVEPRKWARAMLAIGVWNEIADTLHAVDGAPVEDIAASFVNQLIKES